MVTNLTYWIGNDAMGAMAVRVPEMQFSMNVVTALERDQNGNVTRRFEPAKRCY